MKTYKVKTKFVFEGYFEIEANSKNQAREMVEKHCALVMGGNIHTTLPDETVKDWVFNTHPDKKVF